MYKGIRINFSKIIEENKKKKLKQAFHKLKVVHVYKLIFKSSLTLTSPKAYFELINKLI